MKMIFKFLAFLLAVCAAAHAQVAPAATEGAAYLTYSLRYAQTVEFFGHGYGTQQMGIVSGDVGYANGNGRYPTMLTAGSGYRWPISGHVETAGYFENLLFSQGMIGRRWNLRVSDNTSYSHETPTTGFSGVPGSGEPIGEPNPAPSQTSILTLNTSVVENTLNGEYGHVLNYATRLNVGGSSSLVRYPNGDGQGIDMRTGNGGLTRRLDARSSLAADYIYSQFSYPNCTTSSTFMFCNVTFETDSALLRFSRTVSPKITTSVSAGPQWISSSDSTVLPSSTRISVHAQIGYRYKFDSAGLSYSHGSNGGSGYQLGAEIDSIDANYSRRIGRYTTIGAVGEYIRTTGLALNESGVTSAKYGGVQATRRLGRYFSTFANYTAIDQSSSAALPTNTLNQFYQVIGFGIGYTPRRKSLTH